MINQDQYSWLELDKIPETTSNIFLDDHYGVMHDPVEEFTSVLLDPQYIHFVCKEILNVELLPFQLAIIDRFWHKRLPMLIGCRGAGKSFVLAVYSLLKLLLNPGCKVVLVGSSFRQSKQIHDYIVSIWDKAPILQDIAGKNSGPKKSVDRYEFFIGSSVATALPIGDGSKIRGIRANIIIADEFACTGKETLVETDRGIIRIEDCQSNYKDLKLFTGDRNIPLESPDKFFKTPLDDVYKITFRNGITIRCSKRHQINTINGWKLGKDLTTDDYIEFKNEYKFPLNRISIDDNILDEDLAWIFGLLISEGSIVNESIISIHNCDLDLINKAKKIIENKFNQTCYIYTKKETVDSRGWTTKPCHELRFTNQNLRELFFKFGLEYSYTETKKIPWSILQSTREVCISFLQGLFIGDGSCFQWEDRNKVSLGIAYYSVSEQLTSEVQILCSKLNSLGYKTSRKSKLSKNLQWMIRFNGIEAKRLLDNLNISKWNEIAEGVEIHENKDSGLVYLKNIDKWRVEFYYAGKVIRYGSYKTKEEAREVLESNKYKYPICLKVRSVELLSEKEHLYDFHIPNTHSFIGNGIKNHNSISEEIFNVVIQGFAIVSSTPVEKVKEEALINKLKNSGLWTEELEDQHKNKNRGNQIIYSGTAYYAFNHFYKYFQKWREIITSNGDQAKLSSVVDSNDPLSDGFNWKDYCIVRLPYTALPKGLLDSGILAQAKATLNTSQFLCEYSAVFPKDSDGFYRRSIIDAATTTKPINIIDGRKIQFSVLKTGDPKKKYILGIDPAAERDNAALVILEDNGIYRSVVHCWTTNRKKFFALKNKSKESDLEITDDYYRYIAKKIRQLMRDFNISRICMDKNGGGVAIAEALSSKDTCTHDENPVFELIDPEKPKFSDTENGVHILELISPTTDINSQANHGMLKDIQDKVLLFPRFDTVEIEKGMILDNMEPENTFSSYEDLINEIEELKNEMTSIVMTGTSMLGAEKFDTPEVKLEGAKKGRLKKDRYSALLYANYFGRNQNKQEASLVSYQSVGGISPSKTTGNGMYRGFGVAKFGQSNWTKSGNPRFIKREQ
jgi:intein/homing endonuclease